MKFSTSILLPKSEATAALNELAKKTSLMADGADSDKIMEYFMKINDELLNEQDRRKKFKVEQDMIAILRRFLKTFKSRVKQGNLRQNTEINLYERAVSSPTHKKRRKKEKASSQKKETAENSNTKSKNTQESEKMGTLARKLRELKEKDKEKFNLVIQKCEGIKKKELLYY